MLIAQTSLRSSAQPEFIAIEMETTADALNLIKIYKKDGATLEVYLKSQMKKTQKIAENENF